MDGFELRTEKKKEHIINAAIHLFKSLSPNKVSIRDLAMEANVSVVTIYNYFGSKEGLIEEVVRNVLTGQLHFAENIVLSNDAFEEKISQIMFSKETLLQSFHPDFITMILKDKKMAELINGEFMSETYKLINTFINDAKEEGKLSKKLSNELILKVIELYRNDLSSEKSILINHSKSIDEYKMIMTTLLYGIAGNEK